MFKYRMNRPTYWLYVSIFAAFTIAMAYADKLNGGLEFFMLLIGVPRLHDIGRSGWIVAGIIGATFLMPIGAVMAGVSEDPILLIGGGLVIVIAALGVWLGTVPGDANENQWGPPPPPGMRFRNPAGQR